MHSTSILTALLATFATMGMVTAVPVAATGDVDALGPIVKRDDAASKQGLSVSGLLTDVENTLNAAPKTLGGLVGGLVGKSSPAARLISNMRAADLM
ncbi:MAG: hypothetical protein M1836_001777 [Candelina mexicana]|nr:MAG: hypothetical protein M1836_001777 [Candelina mexicana]